MANIKFVLKEPKSKKKTLVYLMISFDYKRLKISTGEKIKNSHWNPRFQRARDTKGHPEFKELNIRLDKLETRMKNAYLSLLNKDIELTPKLLKEKFNEVMGIEEEKKPVPLFDFIDNLIIQRKVTFRPNTIKKYESTKKHLENYRIHKGINSLDFDDITLNFYYDFMKYMKVDLNFAVNTCGKYIATLKTFLNEATDAGVNIKTDFKSSRFTKPYEEVDKIYLTETELTNIYKLDLSKNKKLERVRDLFIVECYLGQRFSDTENLNVNDIKEQEGKSYITLRTIKTKEKVSIPLHPRVKEILAKYNNNFPKSISNQKTNLYLKDIGKLAKIDGLVSTSKNNKGMKVQKYKAKYELITTHTARRSFATNSFLADIPIYSIMKMTGHKTEKSFMGYIRMTSEENAIKLIEHDFFNETKEVKKVKVVNLK